MTVTADVHPVHAAALAWHDAGASVIPARLDGSKAPLGEWKQYQKRRPTLAEIEQWFAAGHPGLGLVCGKVSGGLVMLEAEGRAVAEGMLKRAGEIALAAGDADLWQRVTRGYSEATPSGGVHLIYRIAGEHIPGNQKLARRPKTDGPGVEVLAETRGEGGFVVIAPSHGPTHPTGRAWLQAHGTPATIPTLTLDEHAAVCSILRALDDMPAPEITAPSSAPAPPRLGGELTPGDDYAARTSWGELLSRHGWRLVRQRGKVCDWRRPGKAEGISATTGYGELDLLYVFSTSTEFDSERSYSKIGALAVLEHGGNISEAASALRRAGYGGRTDDFTPLRPFTPDLGATWPPAPPSTSASTNGTSSTESLPGTSTPPPPHASSASALDAAVSTADVAEAHTSWWPYNLAPLIAGGTDLQEIQPTVLARRDGQRLIYPGKNNGLIGESESGKTWVALLACYQEIVVGNHALILDFEDTAPGIVGRLRRFGATDHELGRLHYIAPQELLHAAARNDLEATIANTRPTIAVVDGYNAAMNLLGLDYEKNTDVIRFSQGLLRVIAKTGAAVITIDHVTKSKEGRGSYAIGAQAKRAEVDGCALIVEAVEPFGRGKTGRLKLTVAKDRPGEVRGKSAGAKIAGNVEFRSDADGNVTLKVEAPDLRTREEKGPFRPTVYMDRVSKFLLDVKEATGSAVEKGVNGYSKHIREALNVLVAEGYVSRGPGARGAILYGYIKPYVDGLQAWNPDGGGDRDE